MMAIRQYIGARYVPKFSDVNGGVWDSQYSYEALEIVKNGNDFYTSKTPVPVGVDISNSTYWVKTGDYNGAIAEINSRIDDIVNLRLHVKTPEDFGAVGDGVTDDSAAFQSAVEDCNILALPNIYMIKNVTIDHDVLLIGCGGGINSYPRDDSAAFNNVLTYTGCNVYIKNVIFNGNTYTAAASSDPESYIDINNADNVYISQCTFNNIIRRYSNVDADMWDYTALLFKCVDGKLVIFDGNTINSCGGDELVMITPHYNNKSVILFNNNVFNDVTTGASLNLFANDIQFSKNMFSNFSYPGSILNISADQAIIEGNNFDNCNVRNVIDGIEGGYFKVEDCTIISNIFKGHCENFASIIGSNVIINDNIVYGNSLVIHELTAFTTSRVAASLQNNANRHNANFVCTNNILNASGALTNAMLRCFAVGVNATPLYGKQSIGKSNSAIIKNNQLFFDGTVTGNSPTIFISNVARMIDVSGNLIINPNLDTLSGSAKYIAVIDNRDTSDNVDQCIINDNVVTDTIAGILRLLAVGGLTSGVFIDQLVVNGNYTDGKPLNLDANYSTVIQYAIQS
jgi:hypothetical protein